MRAHIEETRVFGIGMPELIVIFVIALVIFGPAELPKLAKSLGRVMAEFKRTSDDLMQQIHQEMDAAGGEGTKPVEPPYETAFPAAESPAAPASSEAASEPAPAVAGSAEGAVVPAAVEGAGPAHAAVTDASGPGAGTPDAGAPAGSHEPASEEQQVGAPPPATAPAQATQRPAAS